MSYSPYAADHAVEIHEPHYYLAEDGYGDLTLWRDNGDDDPTAVETRHASPNATLAHERWTLLLRGAGLDGEAS